MATLALAALVVFGYALISRALEDSVVSPPMVFTGIGIAVGGAGFGLLDYPSLDTGAVGILAEATLVLVLFTDAIRIDLGKLRSEAQLPARLLGLALPATLILGTVVAYFAFESFGWAAAFALAAILTPTDAALGKPVVSNEDVPVRIRQTINVESGLNDGIMLPIVTVAVALLANEAAGTNNDIVGVLVRQIGLGILLGAAVGWIGGKLLDRFAERGWVEGVMRQLGTMSIGIGAFAFAEFAGGNGFVAAFVAGIAFGAAARDHCQGAYDFAVDEGELLALITFFLFGAVVFDDAMASLDLATIAYVVLSLTVIRMLPVAISLIKAGLRWETVAYIGWFGPRGLASILFGVFLLEESGMPLADEVFSVVVWTVLISIFAHGASAASLTRRYARWYMGGPVDEMAESMDMHSFPTR